MKRIVVIGTGRMGGAFATAFAKRTSHAVSIRGSHAGSSSAAALSRQLGVRVADNKELLAADVVFVATPPAALDDVAATLKGYAGIIVSAMVPGAGGYELKRDDGTSAAEQLARLVPERARRHCVHVHFHGIDPRSSERRKAYGVYLRGR